MTDPAPHAAAEADDRDPSRAANQPRAEPVLPTPAHDRTPSTGTGRPDAATDSTSAPVKTAPIDASSSDNQAGVPRERAVTDVAAAPGTSEGLKPVEGIHTPDVGPGGEQFDTDQPGIPGRTTDSR